MPNAHTAFDITTLSSIKDFGIEKEREAIFNRFAEILNRAIVNTDTAEIGILLNTCAYWNINPLYRKKLIGLLSKVSNLDGLSIAEKRLNPIAAEIYAKRNALTGKYEEVSGISA